MVSRARPSPFCAQHNSQLFHPAEHCVVNRNRRFTQRHGSSLKSQRMQLPTRRRANRMQQLRYGSTDLKHRAHAHPRAAAQRITAGRRQQNRIHVQRRCRAEDCAHIGGVHNVFQHHDPPRIGAQFLHRRLDRPPHSAEDSPGQFIACQFRQHRPVGSINRDRAAARQQFFFPVRPDAGAPSERPTAGSRHPVPVQSPLGFPQ